MLRFRMARLLALCSGSLFTRHRPPRRPNRTLAWALMAALLGVTGALVWAWYPSPPDPGLISRVQLSAQRPCVEMEVVGLRGHGDVLSAWSGAGADTWALTAILRLRLGTQVELFGLPYEQGPDLTGLPISAARDIRPAAAVLEAYVNRRAAACPTEHLVVIGQSEGAAVAHWAYPEIARKVDAVVLLGDPLHVASAPYDEDLGNAPPGQMVVWLALEHPSLNGGDPIHQSAQRVRSYCLPHDQVCGFSFFDRHHDTHLEYRHNPPAGPGGDSVLDLAASFVTDSLVKGRLARRS
jgi:hypothetical protein